MSKPRILQTRRLPASVEQDLNRLFHVQGNPQDDVPTSAQIVERAHSHRADGLLITITEKLDEQTIAALPDSVKIISTYSVGVNHIDLDAAQKRRITVAFTPDAVTDATADIAMLLLLNACRRAQEFQTQLRQGGWDKWSAWKNLGRDPGGKVLGLIGMGRIGRAFAHRARAFGMIIHYHQRNRLPSDLEQGALYHADLHDLLGAADMVSLHTPTTALTKGFINRSTLSMMKPGAIFINTARGDQVDDDALIEALGNGRLFAAGLDVFAGEPNFDKRYLDLPNACLLPHIGTTTEETRTRMGADAIANLCAFFDGNPPIWPILHFSTK